MEWYFILLLVIGALLGIFIIYVLFLFLCSLFIDCSKEYETNNKFYRHLLVWATWLLMHFARISVKVEGMEHLPEGRFLMVANHRSNFDPMISYVVFRKYNLAFVSKADNFNIPIFGKFIRKCAFMAIDREDPRKAMKTIQKAARLMQGDVVSIGIYPEGTRSQDCNMLPFKDGCFKIAQIAKVPIVVVAITGTQKIHKHSPWKRVRVNMKIVESIPTEKVIELRTRQIGERVYNDILQIIQQEER